MAQLSSRPLGQKAQKYFQPASSGSNAFKSGELINFNYTNFKKDPYPLVIIIKYDLPKRKVHGLNLHYLTYPIIKQILMSYADKTFSYDNIKQNDYISNSYRVYKSDHIRQIRKFDSELLLKIMDITRTFDSVDNELIQKQIEQQTNKETNQPSADQMSQGIQSVKTVDQIGTIPTIGDNSKNNG